MAVTAIVSVIISQIKGLPAAAPGAGNTRYARASFSVLGDAVSSGRSRPIPDAGGDFTILPVETAAWAIFRGLDDSASVDIKVEIWEDHGDASPILDTTITGTVSGPWPATNPFTKSVTLGAGPTVQVLVSAKSLNATQTATGARSTTPTKPSGTLAVTQGFFLEFVSIEGLYKPDPTATAPALASKAVPGYFSRDDQGRIFTNRLPNGDWKRDTQFINVQLRITAFGGAQFPGGALVHWRVDDPDDPTNDDPGFHRDWGLYLDPNDYDDTGTPTGGEINDNTLAFSPGNKDDDLLFGAAAKGSNRWKTGPGGEAVSPISQTEATTTLTIVSATLATSSVQIHCPNVQGTSLSLFAEMDGVPVEMSFSDALSGVMTMWSRIDVEVVRMAGAFSLGNVIARIPASFLPMCVQLDFQPERIVSGALDKKAIAPDGDSEDPGTVAWLNNPKVFSRKGTPGWFFLGGARAASPAAPAGKASKPLFKGTTYKLGTARLGKSTITFGTVTVPADARNAEFVEIEWKDGGVTRTAGFEVLQAKFSKGKTVILLSGNDIAPLFTGWDSDGSLHHAFLSQILFFPLHHRLNSVSALTPGGFNIPAAGATVTVTPPGVARETEGISPSVPDAAGKDYFAGRTVVFTSSSASGTPLTPNADFDAEMASTAVHEFVHAFGMPHKCGFWNWKTPRLPDGKTCCMNYDDTWLIDPKTVSSNPTLIPDFLDRMDDNVCGRHLMEVRRVHLERNKGLRW